MKSFIKTAALSILTVSSLSLTVTTQAEALTVQAKNPHSFSNQTIYLPQVESESSQAQVSQEKLVAYGINCETSVIRGRIVSCCVDSYGSWSCVY